jgi:hypothetical protein
MSDILNINIVCSNYNKIYDIIVKSMHNKKDCEKYITKYIKHNGPFSKDGYYYYLRREYSMKIVNPQLLKKKYPKIYEECSRTIIIKPKMIRRIDNV